MSNSVYKTSQKLVSVFTIPTLEKKIEASNISETSNPYMDTEVNTIDISEKIKFILDNEGYIPGLYSDLEMLNMDYDDAITFIDIEMSYGDDHEELLGGNMRAGMDMGALYRKVTLDGDLSKDEKIHLQNEIEKRYIKAQEFINPDSKVAEWGKYSLQAFATAGSEYPLSGVIDALLDGNVELATRFREGFDPFWDDFKDESSKDKYKKDYLDIFLRACVNFSVNK